MQLPYRKPGKYMTQKLDPMLTMDKFASLKKELLKLKNKKFPAATEVARLAELGDFSENVEYQLAKAKLRGINSAILRLEHQLKNAEIIEPTKNKSVVAIGHTVTISNGKVEKTYQILGSTETDPSNGIISHLSPIGTALIGKKIGDKIQLKIKNNIVNYHIIRIT